jgi:hypothetical protein
MKKLFYSLFVLSVLAVCVPAFAATSFSCGDGYVLTNHAKIDGVSAMECQKLWCHDLETGAPMGAGNRAANGYVATDVANELMGYSGESGFAPSIVCFGARKWCAGEPAGEWNPDLGRYTRGGDNTTYTSYQKSGCFAWRLEKPECADGQVAILQDNEWVCTIKTGTSGASRASSMRRTGTIRRR